MSQNQFLERASHFPLKVYQCQIVNLDNHSPNYLLALISDQLNSKEGGEEVGPLELQITTLQKQIKDTEVEKEQLEQYWLKKQSHLVRYSLSVYRLISVIS